MLPPARVAAALHSWRRCWQPTAGTGVLQACSSNGHRAAAATQSIKSLAGKSRSMFSAPMPRRAPACCFIRHLQLWAWLQLHASAARCGSAAPCRAIRQHSHSCRRELRHGALRQQQAAWLLWRRGICQQRQQLSQQRAVANGCRVQQQRRQGVDAVLQAGQEGGTCVHTAAGTPASAACKQPSHAGACMTPARRHLPCAARHLSAATAAACNASACTSNSAAAAAAAAASPPLLLPPPLLLSRSPAVLPPARSCCTRRLQLASVPRSTSNSSSHASPSTSCPSRCGGDLAAAAHSSCTASSCSCRSCSSSSGLRPASSADARCRTAPPAGCWSWRDRGRGAPAGPPGAAASSLVGCSACCTA